MMQLYSAVSIFALVATFGTQPVQAQVMEELPAFPGFDRSAAVAISSDGMVAVGWNEMSSTSDSFAVRWLTSTGQIENLGYLIGGTTSAAYGVNVDGTVVVGKSDSPDGVRAFRWTEGGVMESLGTLPGGGLNPRSRASDVNANGKVVVGDSSTTIVSTNGDITSIRAFRWVEGQGMEDLGALGGVSGNSFANGVNAAGNVVVGSSGLSDNTHAFRWVENGGPMQDLGVLSGGTNSEAEAVNAYGDIVVGVSVDASFKRTAFYWVDGTGMKSLGALDGDDQSYAYDVNAYGDVVVGQSWIGSSRRAFRWDEDEGMEDLGFLTGDTDAIATSVSADGEIVVGYSSPDDFNTYRAFIYRTSMLDLENTQKSAIQAAAGQAAALDLARQTLLSQLDRELEVAVRAPAKLNAETKEGAAVPVSQIPVALRFDMIVGEGRDDHERRLGAITGAVGLSDVLTLGGFVVAGQVADAPDGIELDGDQAGLGLYLRSRDFNNGGLTWKIGVGASGGDVAIKRDNQLSDTEAGSGDSKLVTRAATLEVGYDMKHAVADVTPFLRVAHSTAKRDGYSEGTDIDFPIAFNDYRQSVTTASVGVDTRRLHGATELRFGAGMEIDLHRSDDPVTGSSAIPGLGVFSIHAPEVTNDARAFASVGLSHFFVNASALRLDAKLGQSAYSNAPTASVALGYEIRY